MFKLIIALFISFSINVKADINDNLEFESINLYELSKLVFTNLNRLDFTADDVFINDKRGYTVILKDKSARQMRVEVSKVIKNAGYFIDDTNKIIRITKQDFSIKEEKEPHVYFPKHKAIDYLTDQLTTVFKNDSFTISRQIDNPKTVETDSKDKIHDDGQSAFSKISKDSDFLIFNSTKKDFDLFQKLVAQIDIPDNQVEIKAYLYEVKSGKSDQSGFKLAASLLGGIVKASYGSVDVSNSLSLSLLNIDAALSLLNSDDRFKLVSSPYLITKNNQKAVFSVGSDVPVLGQISQNQNGQTLQSIEYKQSGVILDILPKIYDKSIELTIHHQISNFIPTTNGVNNSPTLIKRELNSVVKTQLNDVLLLGGLNESTSSANKSGVFFLPDFLKNKSSNQTQSEIMLLLSVKKI